MIFVFKNESTFSGRDWEPKDDICRDDRELWNQKKSFIVFVYPEDLFKHLTNQILSLSHTYIPLPPVYQVTQWDSDVQDKTVT